jgi:hypothetical protein
MCYVPDDIVAELVEIAKQYCVKHYGTDEIFPCQCRSSFYECITYNEFDHSISLWFDHKLDNGFRSTGLVSRGVSDEFIKVHSLG